MTQTHPFSKKRGAFFHATRIGIVEKGETDFFDLLLLYFFPGFGYNNWAEFGISTTETE
jgi:hypothetical protein